MTTSKHAGGRPPGVQMPCGWKCGAQLTARDIRSHFVTCPQRPGTARMQEVRKVAGSPPPQAEPEPAGDGTDFDWGM